MKLIIILKLITEANNEISFEIDIETNLKMDTTIYIQCEQDPLQIETFCRCESVAEFLGALIFKP